ncbi:MAG: hypothetical protein CFH10_00179 [Alphaproteobacteria bacterium MarineAlpha4_Bin2]|nr:MAG: hypothetical protein CFH10_00179 [Alphaproteobacteria bacterium MarineAlpha4_Bin2]
MMKAFEKRIRFRSISVLAVYFGITNAHQLIEIHDINNYYHKNKFLR